MKTKKVVKKPNAPAPRRKHDPAVTQAHKDAHIRKADAAAWAAMKRREANAKAAVAVTEAWRAANYEVVLKADAKREEVKTLTPRELFLKEMVDRVTGKPLVVPLYERWPT